MARTYISLLLMVFLSITVFEVGVIRGCYLDTIGGGCPDVSGCVTTCSSCARGVGQIRAACVAPTGITPSSWTCRCFFLDGAPCPPTGGPKCPGGGPPLAHHHSLPSS